MDYYKIEVHPKEETEYNPLHDKINGKRCRNRVCPLNDGVTIEVDFENEDWHAIRTSTVLNMYESGSGMYILETRNTIYVFTPINEEEGKNEV